MAEYLRMLPIGTQSFQVLRSGNMIYIDKTGKLLDLIKNFRWRFLSRPRRFGKSLALSTLEAMFAGKAEHIFVLELKAPQMQRRCRKNWKKRGNRFTRDATAKDTPAKARQFIQQP